MNTPSFTPTSRLMYWIMGAMLGLIMFLLGLGINSVSGQIKDEEVARKEHARTFGHRGAEKAIAELKVNQEHIRKTVDETKTTVGSLDSYVRENLPRR